MILYITRKFPPSVGGMQKVNAQLYFHLAAWGGSQKWLVFVYPYLFFKVLFLLVRHVDIQIIFLGDALLLPLGLLLKTLSRQKIVVMAHGPDVTWPFSPYQRIVPRCMKRLDKTICVSHKTKAECLKRKIPQNLLRVIPNGIDVGEISKSMGREEAVATLRNLIPSVEKQPKIILSVGRMVVRKGFHLFVENALPKILKEHDDAQYLVAGDGPCRHMVETSIRRRKLENHVRLLGRVTDEELVALYSLANVFVMPNIKVANDMEGFGIVVLEAGLHKTPVVAFRLEDIENAVNDSKNGILVRNSDHDRLAKEVSELLGDPEKQKRLGESAKTYVVENYSIAGVAETYLKEFETLIPNTIGQFPTSKDQKS